MDKTLQMTVNYSYRQRVYTTYTRSDDIIKRGCEQSKTYEAFNDQHLIQSLVCMEKREKAIKKWVSAYGFLSVASDADSETIDGFWNNAEEFSSLWWLYSSIRNRQLDELRKFVRFADVDIFDMAPPGAHSRTVYFHNIDKNGAEFFTEHDAYFREKTADINEKPLRFYQMSCFRYIVYAVEKRLRGLAFTSRERRIIAEEDYDHFKVIPILQPKNLLQALYLQFYVLLKDADRKICGCCGSVFTPSRPDVAYCSPQCKQREKMRRYRSRKKEESCNGKGKKTRE